MARVVAAFEQDNYDFQPRQVPIEVDNIKMVVEFSDKCIDCEKVCRLRQKDLEHFSHRFNALTKDEVAVSLLVSGRDILGMLPLMVPCVGCRKSVERLFYQLQKSQHPALDPLTITPRGELSVQHEYLFDPRSLFSLFHLHGPKLQSVVEAMLKSKKNKRCNLHSLETHKSKTMGCWLEAWDSLSESCMDKVLLVDMPQLLVTIEEYLVKHKFCAECKTKVMLAYNILIGQHDSSSEEGYCAELFENLRCCIKEQHIHVVNDIDFIADLFEKAEPEYFGGKRDRHAKTLDIAQEEILICLGIYIFERLHKIWQKLRNEEQTWLILLYLGVDALRKSCQAALERKQGVSDLELLCEQLQEKEKKLGVKREIKRQKKKQKKTKIPPSSINKSASDILVLDIPCQCSSRDPDNVSKNKNHNDHDPCHLSCHCSCGDSNLNSLTSQYRDLGRHGLHSTSGQALAGNRWFQATQLGSCESCSSHTSNESLPDTQCPASCTDRGDNCRCDQLRTSAKHLKGPQVQVTSCGQNHKAAFQSNDQPLLHDLLDELCWAEDEDEDAGIAEEEILAFKARQVEVESKRQKLRENLRQRFQELYLSSHVSNV